MKKLFLTLIMIGTALYVQAQSPSTVRGKTRDGKTLEVKYYHGTVSDQIESVQYQVVDELQSKVGSLQSDLKSLQNRLNATNDELRQLRKDVEGGNADAENLRQKIAEKNATIDSLNQQRASLNNELLHFEAQQMELQARYDSLFARQQSLQAEKQSLLNEKQSLEDERQSLLAKSKPEPKVVVVQAGERPEKSPVVGVGLGIGTVFMDNSIDESWAKDTRLGGCAAIYFGTPCLFESFPISIEVGVGMRRFVMAGHRDMSSDTLGCTDRFGDDYQAYLLTTDLKEQLVLTYIDIPIRLCFGQPAKDRVTAYFKIGVTPSINLLSNLDTYGTYNLKGHYDYIDTHHSNVTYEYNPILGFGIGDYYEDVTLDISRFNLWGNAAFGVYVPFKGTNLLLNAGVKADYSILSLGKVNNGHFEGTPLRKAGLLNAGGRVFVPSVEIGLVYTIK